MQAYFRNRSSANVRPAAWLLLFFCLSACCGIGSSAADADTLSAVLKTVEVKAVRPMSQIGQQRIDVDSASLRENISLSLADVVSSNPSVFVKTSGRATLSTVALRGASASHTLVEWNGLPVNSPLLGMTDFSLIPAYFIDRASIFYGGSSVASGSGGLGGAVSLTNSLTDVEDGFSAQYVQGAGSFMTFDEYASVAYANDFMKSRTRFSYSSSRNDFSFVNHDKKLNIYDDEHNIVGQYYPREKNRNGAYRDLNVMQQIEFRLTARDKLAIDAWWLDSNREIPLTTVDYAETKNYENRQRENTIRGVARWTRSVSPWRSNLTAGISHTWSGYDYSLDNGSGVMNRLTESRSHITTAMAKLEADYFAASNFSVNGTVEYFHDCVDSRDYASLTGDLGFDKKRDRLAVSLSGRWQVSRSAGVSATVREEAIHDNGRKLSVKSPIVNVAGDWMWNDFIFKGSVTRNVKTPTLNDLYFVPGGNPDLRAERSMSYDAGATYSSGVFSGSITGFYSRIDDWILWMPTTKGFFSPSNVKRVDAYGVEMTAAITIIPFRDASLDLRGSYSWTPSKNRTGGASAIDESFGKQLPYIPVHTASVSGIFAWRQWSATYRFNYYSKRYTTSSNEQSASGALPHYFMNDLSIGRRFEWSQLRFSAKLALNNLFNADYRTVLTHPMPGFNFEIFLSFEI